MLPRGSFQEKTEEQRIDYIIDLLDIPFLYYFISLAIAVSIGITGKRWKLSFLLGYMFFFLSVVLFTRIPSDAPRAEFQPFWSYSDPLLREEIIINVAAFVPVGILSGSCWGWKGILAGIVFSAIAEISQFVTCRGLFEFDDIIHNGMGTVIGVVLAKWLQNHRRKNSG